MDFGFATGLYSQLTVERSLTRMAEKGVRYFELAGLERLEATGKIGEAIRTIKETVESINVQIVQVHGPTGRLGDELSTLAAKSWTKSEKRLHKCLGYCIELEAGVMVVHPALGSTDLTEQTQLHVRRVRELNLEFWKELSGYAGDIGVKIALENAAPTVSGIPSHSSYGSKIPDLLDLAVNTDPDVVGLCLDTGHALRYGLNPAEASLQAGKYLIATHVNDYDGDVPDYGHDHLPPLTGICDWRAFFKSLSVIGFLRPVIMEIHPRVISLQESDNWVALGKLVMEAFTRDL